MEAVRFVNLGVRFLAEVAGIAAIAYWGFGLDSALPVRLLAGVGLPLLVILVWGLFVAPKSAVPVAEPVKAVLAVIVMGLAALALAGAGQPGLAAAYFVVVCVNAVLLQILGRGEAWSA